MNLAGIEHTALTRGMVLATPGKFRATRRIDARLELLPSAPKLKQRSKVHFHAGTSETVAEVFLFGRPELAPGQSALAHLRLQDEVLVLPGDRFIVRQSSPLATIGGGDESSTREDESTLPIPATSIAVGAPNGSEGYLGISVGRAELVFSMPLSAFGPLGQSLMMASASSALPS